MNLQEGSNKHAHSFRDNLIKIRQLAPFINRVNNIIIRVNKETSTRRVEI